MLLFSYLLAGQVWLFVLFWFFLFISSVFMWRLVQTFRGLFIVFYSLYMYLYRKKEWFLMIVNEKSSSFLFLFRIDMLHKSPNIFFMKMLKRYARTTMKLCKQSCVTKLTNIFFCDTITAQLSLMKGLVLCWNFV